MEQAEREREQEQQWLRLTLTQKLRLRQRMQRIVRAARASQNRRCVRHSLPLVCRHRHLSSSCHCQRSAGQQVREVRQGQRQRQRQMRLCHVALHHCCFHCCAHLQPFFFASVLMMRLVFVILPLPLTHSRVPVSVSERVWPWVQVESLVSCDLT